jgi:hypothetical protein
MRNRIVGRVLHVPTMGLLIAVIYALIGWAMAAAVADGGPLRASVENHSALQLIPDAGSMESIIAIAILAALLFLFAWLKQPAGPGGAAGFAFLHTAGHALALCLLLVGALSLLSGLDAEHISIGWAVGVIAGLGYFAGLMVFGLYLWLANKINPKQHATEIYGGLASTEYKNFLRLRLTEDESLTIYPIGIKRSVSWFHRAEGNPVDPWFVPAGGQEPKAELLEGKLDVPPPRTTDPGSGIRFPTPDSVSREEPS